MGWPSREATEAVVHARTPAGAQWDPLYVDMLKTNVEADLTRAYAVDVPQIQAQARAEVIEEILALLARASAPTDPEVP